MFMQHINANLITLTFSFYVLLRFVSTRDKQKSVGFGCCLLRAIH